MYEKTYLKSFLERVVEVIQVSSLKRYPHGLWMVGSAVQSSLLREIEKKGENSHKAFMGTFSSGWYLVFFRKTLIIIPISTNIYRLYMCDLLGPYISLVNYSIDQITFYRSTLINYPHQHID